MRSFRRLPPLLRVASLLGLLLVLAALVMFVELLITTSMPTVPHWLADSPRMGVIALNLIAIGAAYDFPARLYLLRWHRPDSQPFPLDTWQSQVRAVLLVAALPLGTLVLAVVVPPTSLAFAGVFSISILEALVLFGAALLMNIGRQAVG